ncbi:hypothetical protein BLNAU_16450 [Blattamonas nauphoetae]|uniref:Protein kinase domain-containing protein n=1 Tax=Blattamonas nauphoetae TaxID=2049346 RepID=A0ABQ9X9M8_9EUKA|nr:hypothetical protein BLNAU_16450 [Blattamonas nauphoetae]
MDRTTQLSFSIRQVQMNSYRLFVCGPIYTLFNLALRMELDHETANSDVLFASICSSYLRASHIEFTRSGWGPLMTLERMEEFSNVDPSITLANCVIHSKSGRMGAVLSDTRGLEGHESIFLTILNSKVENQQIVGHDGIGVGEGADGTGFLGFSGITTAFVGISFWNVSSLPGSVASASPSFRQQMIGSSVWGSNNHLSGSTVRDMNSGGSVLCSNTTFSWCSTTSEERPSSSQRHPSSLSSNAKYEHTTFDGNDGNVNVTRLNITTDTTVTNCTFQNMAYSTSKSRDGGSALYFVSVTNTLTILKSSFVNCTVVRLQMYASLSGGCIFAWGSSNASTNSIVSVHNCSFVDWYPTNIDNEMHTGGGIGFYNTSPSVTISDSSFTLTGSKSQDRNGGFLSSDHSSSQASLFLVSNCRLTGDKSSIGYPIYRSQSTNSMAQMIIIDTAIIDTNSNVHLDTVTGSRPFQMTRTTLHSGQFSITKSVSTKIDPISVVDCEFVDFSVTSSDSSSDFYFFGTRFTSRLSSLKATLLYFERTRHVILQNCTVENHRLGASRTIVHTNAVSLILDTCTFQNCTSSQQRSTPFNLLDTAFSAHSCFFTALSCRPANLFQIERNGSFLLEDCRFDLATSNMADIIFDKAAPTSLLNASSVTNCSSNREINVTTDGKTGTVCPLFNIIQTPTAKSEIKLEAETDENGNPIETIDTLWPEIQSIETDSSTLLSLSDGPFTESEILPILRDVEIVGNGTESVHVTLDESPRPHTTQLTAELEVGAGANLTLRSMTLVPSSPSSPLVAMKEDGFLSVKNVVGCDSMWRTKELFSMSAGTIRFFHSRFSSIAGSTALIVVSGNGSITLSDTLFLTISRTHTSSANGSVQSGSCVEGRTSGLISITFCKFGGCSSNGRAGVIDIVLNDATSRVEMEGCQFDQNTAGSELEEAEKGDDVVLKGFSNEQLSLNFTTIESLTTIISFLIDDSHPIVSIPHTLKFSQKGFDMPLAWSFPNVLCKSLLSDIILQFLLGSRLHNNVHTAIITDCEYVEEMKPFTFRNGSVEVNLDSKKSRINVTQPNNTVFCTLINASFMLSYLTLSITEMTSTVFSVDSSSSIHLSYLTISFSNNTLTHQLINSTGRVTNVLEVRLPSGLTLLNVPFVRHIRKSNDGVFQWLGSDVSDVTLTSHAFLTIDGMSSADVLSGSSFINLHSSCDGSFLNAKNCSVSMKSTSFVSCSAQHGGVCSFDSCDVTLSDVYFTNCSSTATNEDGTPIGRGGVLQLKGTTAKTPLSMERVRFESNEAEFGNDVFVDGSLLEDDGPDRLKDCGGEQRGMDKNRHIHRLSNHFSVDQGDRFRHFLNTSYPNGTNYQRTMSVSTDLVVDPIVLEQVNIHLHGSRKCLTLTPSLTAGASIVEINDGSRILLDLIVFHLQDDEGLVTVTSSDGWLEMVNCSVLTSENPHSQSLIMSAGCGLSLSSVAFAPLSSSRATFSVPLVSFHPTPQQDQSLGSGSLSMVSCTFTNLSFSSSPMITIETSSEVTLKQPTFGEIKSQLSEGQYVSLKGYNFKQQIVPENWANSYSKDKLVALCGEDTSLAANHKWRKGSLLYWLFSPLEEIVGNVSDSDAVDHPNCGSSEFKCSTLDSAFQSASLNSLEVITLLSPSSLERTMTVTEIQTVRSSDTTQREVSVTLDSSIAVDNGVLSFVAIWFTSASSSAFSNGDTFRTVSLFVVESGSLSLNSCSLSSFTLASSPLIAYLTGSLSLILCELSSIDRLSGKGSILSTEMKNGMRLTMDSVDLSSMPCSSESPAVLLNFSSITPSSPFPPFSLTNLRFEGTDDQLATARFVEVAGMSLQTIIPECDARFEGSYSNDSNPNHLWSIDEEIDLSASLLFYLLGQEGPVTVQENGSDVDRCGYTNVWCSSVERAISRTTDRILSEIVILGSAPLFTPTSLTTSVSITKREHTSLLSISQTGSLMTTPQHSLLIEDLTLLLPLIHTSEAVVVVTPFGSATLNSIMVTSPGGSDATLVRVTGGKADITDLVMESEMKENTHLVEIVGGKVSVDSLRVESRIGLNSSIVWMKEGSVNVSGISIVKDTAALIVIEAKDVRALELDSCHFSGSTKSTLAQNNAESDICSWSKSYITLTNCSSSFHSIEMKHLQHGAVSMVGGELTLTSCTFIDNSPSNAAFPSLRRNVLCSDGKVSIETVGGGDGHSSPHHWISTNNCSVEKEDTIHPAPFFFPTLSATKSTSNFDRKVEKYDIVMKGDAFIPCGLSLDVFERVKLSKTEFKEGEHILMELDPSEATSWKEDTIELSLHQSSLASLNKKHDLHCRVLFGENGKTDSYSLTRLKGNMSQAGRVVSIVLPIVCAALLFIILLVIVLVLSKRRRMKNQAMTRKESSELDQSQVEVKEEEFASNNSLWPLFQSSSMTQQPASLIMMSEDDLQDQIHETQDRPRFSDEVEVLKCDDDHALIRVDRTKTLFNALHIEKKISLPKMEIRRQLVNGLQRLVQHNPFSETIAQLTSHWVLFDPSGSVCLKLDQNLNEMGLTVEQIANQKKMREEGRRWSAPEQIVEENPNEKEKEQQTVSYHPQKAAVFRLGLILWELETGLVPFGELDAVSASRQVKGGLLPLIHNWDYLDLANTITECLSYDPDDRPTLSSLQTRFTTPQPPDPPHKQQQPVVSNTVIG